MSIKREKIIGLAAVLLLHAVGFYGLCRYRIIAPPTEALTVFATLINPPAAAKRAEPAVPKPKPAAPKPVLLKPAKPAPVSRETPRQLPPVSAHLLVSAAPVTSPAQPVAPPAPAAPPAPTPVSVPTAAPSGVQGSPSAGGSAGRPVQLTGDLSLSCPERKPPVYPQLSLRRNEQGQTVLLVELDEFGRVVNVTIRKKSGFSRLDEAAVAAVKTWRCTPAQRGGAAVHAVALQPFNFTIKGP